MRNITMSPEQLIDSVINFLQAKNFKFTRYLGSGGFADVLAFLNPEGKEIAVKIVKREYIWPIEDRYWPKLKHKNLIEVYDIIKIKKIKVKLYLMPVLSQSLEDAIESKAFRQDPESFERVKKWFFQILSAVEYLHQNGFAHMDLKSDNVMIDAEDNAVVVDFTGLNFTKDPIQRLISPEVFHPPECFEADGKNNVRGQHFDIWTLGLLLLNAVTGHYFAKKVKTGEWSHLSPILQKSLTEKKFCKLLKRNFPRARLSGMEVYLTLHFVKFLLNLKPEDRPCARRAKMHLLMKSVWNPFIKELIDMYQHQNPFKYLKKGAKNHGDLNTSSLSSSQNKGNVKNKGIKNWILKKVKKLF